MTDPPFSYPELADRIQQVLGIRPSPATLRAAAATSTRPGRGTAITTGMPTPTRDRAGRAQFDAAAINTWLQRHPQLEIRRHQQTLATAPRAERPTAVATARSVGLSWQEIADACGAADDTTYTRQWAQQRFGRTARTSPEQV